MIDWLEDVATSRERRDVGTHFTGFSGVEMDIETNLG